MAGEQYEGAIKEAVSRVDELASSMEKVREDFLSATTAWFKQFATSSVERAVMEGGDVTKSLQDADLGRLKAELKDLIGRAEGLVTSHVGRDNHWIHTQKDAIPADGAMAIELRYAMRGNNPPELLDGPVRSLTAHVGKLIMQYGFQKGTQKPPQAGPWDPAYRTSLTWSSSMVAAATTYKKLIGARLQLRDLETKKREAQAKAR